MLAIGRSVFRARLHSSLPVTTSWTAADRAPTPAGPLLAEAACAAGAAVSAPATRATPATRPVTRAVSQPLVTVKPRSSRRRQQGQACQQRHAAAIGLAEYSGLVRTRCR